MEQLWGFNDENHQELACHLHKSLYGLKEAFRTWFWGSLYSFWNMVLRNRRFIICYLHVLTHWKLCASIHVWYNCHMVQHFYHSWIYYQFKHKFLYILIAKLLSWIWSTRISEGLSLKQSKYISDILDSTEKVGAKPLACPITLRYQSFLSWWHWIISRPDTSYSVYQVCQLLHNQKDIHCTEDKRVLRHLNVAIDDSLL